MAIIPAIEFQRIDDLVVLPDLAIAAKRRVRSLLIVSRKPIAEVQSIALDRSSRSTQALTRILCAEHWQIKPAFFEATFDSAATILEQADAALLIGDPALRLAISIAGNATLGRERRIDVQSRQSRSQCDRNSTCVRCCAGMAPTDRPPSGFGGLGRAP